MVIGDDMNYKLFINKREQFQGREGVRAGAD